ncbi:MAG: FAD:protein FMN transferase [bacterium]
MRTLFALFIFITLYSCSEAEPVEIQNSGQIFGTSFNIKYFANQDYAQQIDSLFAVINQSMSTYMEDSDISKINRNEASAVDQHFERVFKTSKKIYKETNGVFDPTIGAVVNAWDFGPKGAIVALDSIKIDSLMKSVGLDKVKLRNRNLIKESLYTFIDFNAIAKGYAVDVIAEYLETKGIINYLVEIGGELRTKGENTTKNSDWRIGIDLPNFEGQQEVLQAITLSNNAMATSGTYRKYKIDENGNRYAHIIDTETGYPSKSNVLSVSVITSDCMTADAYATAFQAMGIDSVKDLLKYHPELKVFFIYENEKKELATLALNGFPTK